MNGPPLAARESQAPARRAGPRWAGGLTFSRLKWTSFAHSLIYTALLVSAFAAGKPEPLTFVLGLTHGLLWILMSAACLTAARLGIVSLRLAVAVAVLGGIGPFFGSAQFIREDPSRAPRGRHEEPGSGPGEDPGNRRDILCNPPGAPR